MSLENLNNDEETGFEEEGSSGDSLESTMEDTIRETVEILEESDGNEEEFQKVSGDKSEEGKAPTADETREAAKTLAKAKRGKKGTAKEEIGAAPAETEEPNIQAPDSWPIESKEAFNKLPAIAKKESMAFLKRMEGHSTKIIQNLRREESRSQEVNKILDEYAPVWESRGISRTQAIRELCATHANMAHRPVETLAQVMRARGVTLEMLHGYLQTGQAPQGGASAAPAQAPQQKSLTEQDILRIVAQSQQQASYRQAVNTEAQQLDTLRREVGPDGRYRYPELWDKEEIFGRVEPLIEGLRKKHPQMSVVEATKQAISALRILDGKPGIPSSQDLRFPAGKANLSQVKNASSSVRGRGSFQSSALSLAKPTDKIEDTLAETMAELSGTY